MASSKNVDFISICGESSGGHCGYCNLNSDSKSSYGITCDKMKTETYLKLMNRGWRRCGTYYYKPFNESTCCPLYTIRCNANEFKLSKSQKKVLKRMEDYLTNGKSLKVQVVNACGDTRSSTSCSNVIDENKKSKAESLFGKKFDKSRKAKTIRYNLKLDKLRKLADSQNKSYEDFLNAYNERRCQRLQKNKEKSLQEYLNYSNVKGAKHTLNIKTVRCFPESKSFTDTLEQEHQIYEKYQCSIHHDAPSDVTMKQFSRFLVKGGLVNNQNAESIDLSNRGCRLSQGQYHQQYWLDGKQLIAVGVIDILPTGISSVYLFYDPSFSFLNLGVYTALHELNFVNQMRLKSDEDDFIYYYMGFYVHSCVKMRYKAQFNPSFIACPVTFAWVPVDLCKKVLDGSKYGRFSDLSSKDPLSLSTKTFDQISDLITVIINGKTYKLSKIKDKITPFFLNELKQLAKLLGSQALCSVRISL